MEQTQIQKLHERVQALEERDSNRHAETTPRSYTAISVEKQRGFHRAASAGACLDGSC